MKKIIRITTFLLLITLAFVGCGQKVQPKSQETTQKASVNVGLLPDLQSLPVVVAKMNGYFEEVGVEVKINQFRSAKDRDSALQAGELDVVNTDLVAVALAQNGGFDLKATSQTDGSFKMVVNKDKGITDIDGLKSKKIGLSKNTVIEYIIDKTIETKDMTEKDIDKQAIPQIPVRLEMLAQGKIDAAVLPDPLATVAIVKNGTLLTTSEEMGLNPTVFAFSNKYITENKNTVEKFYNAYNKAVKYLNDEDPSKYMDAIIKEAGFPEVVKGNMELPTYKQATKPSEEEVKAAVIWAKDKGLVKEEISYEKMVADIIK